MTHAAGWDGNIHMHPDCPDGGPCQHKLICTVAGQCWDIAKEETVAEASPETQPPREWPDDDVIIGIGPRPAAEPEKPVVDTFTDAQVEGLRVEVGLRAMRTHMAAFLNTIEGGTQPSRPYIEGVNYGIGMVCHMLASFLENHSAATAEEFLEHFSWSEQTAHIRAERAKELVEAALDDDKPGTSPLPKFLQEFE